MPFRHFSLHLSPTSFLLDVLAGLFATWVSQNACFRNQSFRTFWWESVAFEFIYHDCVKRKDNNEHIMARVKIGERGLRDADFRQNGSTLHAWSRRAIWGEKETGLADDIHLLENVRIPLEKASRKVMIPSSNITATETG